MALVRRDHDFGDDYNLVGFAGEDHELLSLFAACALEDVHDQQASQKGKARHDAPLNDAEIALRLYAEEAEALAVFSRDRALAHSVDSALTTDRTALAEFMREELDARYDHEMALALAQGRPVPPRPQAAQQQPARAAITCVKPLDSA
jgi:hypothetical protein